MTHEGFPLLNHNVRQTIRQVATAASSNVSTMQHCSRRHSHAAGIVDVQQAVFIA